LLAILIVLQLLDPNKAWMMLIIGFGGLWLLMYLWSRQLAEGLRIHRHQLYGWLQVGDWLEERFVLSNQSLVPAVGLYESQEKSAGEGGIIEAVPLLPVSHLVGNPPELAENVVMQVQVNDPAFAYTVGQPYWRSHTYEEYTSRGWLVGEVLFEPMPAGEKLSVNISEDSKVYQIDFYVARNIDQRLYYTGELITADQEFGMYLRVPQEGLGEEDFYAGLMEAQNYQVEIAWVSYAASDLNTATENYPDWITERYLQLPEDLPRRVIDLAKQITKDAETPYQQAAAIESYLRHYPYNLQVLKPPLNRDVVDYFLFDLKEGYCDYFASAMVVLSRAVGLPARLVVGYASGTYSMKEGHYQVTEADAHSWVEVYFPEFGWVEFEPTAGRSLFDRESEEYLNPIPETEFAFPSRTALFWKSFGTTFLYFVSGFILFAGLSLGGDLMNLRSKSPERMA
jgi:transglutaminase-like putative cysteine protease